MTHTEPEYRRLLHLAAALRGIADEVHTAAVRGTPSMHATWIADHIAGIAELRRAWWAHDSDEDAAWFALRDAIDALNNDARHLTARLGLQKGA